MATVYEPRLPPRPVFKGKHPPKPPKNPFAAGYRGGR